MNANKPKVSVIVPCYNAAKFLDRCMESLDKTTYEHKEVIFVNDGSTDDTPSMLEEYKKQYPYVRVVHKKNGGISSARNAGLDIATGEYVMFPDPDDYVSVDYITTPANVIHNGNHDMVLFGFTGNWGNNNRSFVYPIEAYDLRTNQEILRVFFPRFLGLTMEMMDKYLRGGEFTNDRETGQVWRWIYRKSLLDEHSIRFISDIANEDTVFNAECLLNARSLKSIRTLLYNYEPRPDGMMNMNNQTEKMIKNKYDFLNHRKRLGNIYEQKTGRNALALYGGSLVMSAIQLGLVMDGLDGYKRFHDYVMIPEVKESIKIVRLHGGNLKASFLILFLKVRLYRTFFFILKIAKKSGLKIHY